MLKKLISAVNAAHNLNVIVTRCKNAAKPVIQAAFPNTIPIMAGYGCLGFALGILMSASGFSPVITIIMSLIVYAGSGQFVAVNLLLSVFNPLGAFLLELMVNARHVFYGLSMLDKYNDAGRKKWYMIAGLTDETFSTNCGVKPPPGIDRGQFMFAITILNHVYWVTAAAFGAVFGAFVRFDANGLDFVMTALFIVIFIEQWLKEKNHASALIGFLLSVACLLYAGAESFLIPAMLAILLALTVLRRPLERLYKL
ncbi:MAG: AzlC family ABC transporter permease [Clostridiales bacterium]|jgi:4-azaleucine resistance transporter AzlC|nr:AzlC family ABC transporter permease [Clostridiales bacterium]